MPLFKTRIPIDLERLKKTLPPDYTIEATSLISDDEGLHAEIVWRSELLRTPYTFPVEFTAEDLAKQKLPAAVTLRPDRARTAQKSAVPVRTTGTPAVGVKAGRKVKAVA